LAAAQGPKSLARAARWAQGYAGFVTVTDDLASDAQRIRSAWVAAGRADSPYLMTAEMVALTDGERPETPGHDMWPMLLTADDLRRSIDRVAAAGFDEFMLVTPLHDPGHLDMLLKVIEGS
jgi:alkanesulfonate monooxygenase SsuD/methylene tetrahydromethanopterin reductase-like flavin-dependent oxidoreductase (luciferase family)